MTERLRPAHPVLLYDDHCKFCRASAVLVETWDRAERLDFLPLSDPLAEKLLAPMPEAQRLDSIHVVQPDGTVTSAGDALLAAFAELPVGSLVSDAAGAVPGIRTGIKTLFAGCPTTAARSLTSSRTAIPFAAGVVSRQPTGKQRRK